MTMDKDPEIEQVPVVPSDWQMDVDEFNANGCMINYN